jgi:hypothetical protein
VDVPRWCCNDERRTSRRFFDDIHFTRTAATALSSSLSLSSTATSLVEKTEYDVFASSSLDDVQSLTERAIYEYGKEEGLFALRQLSRLCTLRVPFQFSNEPPNKQQQQQASRAERRLISLLPKLLPSSTVEEVLQIVRKMESNRWFSDNLDSVDRLPSIHLNLVRNGEPLFPVPEEGEEELLNCFEGGIHQLYKLVQPYIYDVLLPYVNQRLFVASGTTTSSTLPRPIRVSEVFLRRYGEGIGGQDDLSRNGISAHYDVFSKVTAVVALDDVAAEGRNGLFTTVTDDRTGRTSNHKSLRRFFPLGTGDCVIHSWDVLHGVDIERGLDRTNLIVWFDEEEPNEDNNHDGQKTKTIVSPWLVNQPNLNVHGGSDDVLQFVLASALSSIERPPKNDEDENENKNNIVRLYLQSASQKNNFAMTRMGSLCEEGALSSSPEFHDAALKVLDELRPVNNLPIAIQQMVVESSITDLRLAIRFWFEGAVAGNVLAQKALADELMLESSQSGNADRRLLAAILFALAAQQDDEGASQSLSRVIDHEIATNKIDCEDDFLASPVVQAANAAFEVVKQ